MKILDYEGLKQVVSKIKGLIDKKADKVEGKDLSTNDFSNVYKEKLNGINQVIEGNSIYDMKIIVEGGEAFIVYDEKGKTIFNDFYRVNVNDEKVRFRIKSTSKGVILFYSLEDESLRYAIHVYPEERDYEIDFGKFVSGEMIFTTVTMPEDKVSVIREEVAG